MPSIFSHSHAASVTVPAFLSYTTYQEEGKPAPELLQIV